VKGLHLSLQLGLECQGVELHLFDHGQKAVGAGGREVLLKPYAIDEVEVGIQYGLGRLTAQHADEQGNNALGDDGIAVGSENNLTVNQFGFNPNLTLAPVDEVLRGFLFLDRGASSHCQCR